MQPQATYEKEDAKSIINGYLNGWVEWRDDGLFIRQDFTENDITCSLFQWTPACNMEWDGAPDPTTAPSLPFPFTASQLAAFMLNGIGAVVAPAYGAWEDGPDEAAMDEVMGIRARRAREALRKAFSLYREAEKVVGELAPEVRNECRSIHPAILRVQGNKLALQATLEHLHWCRAMTRQLLQPQATTPSPESVVPTPEECPFAREEAYARKVFESWSEARANKSNDMDKAVIDEIAIGDEIEELQAEIRYWEGRDDTSASDAEIKLKNLKPLCARMTELDAIERLLRGDYGPKVITPNPTPAPQAAPVVAVVASRGVNWPLIKPQRFPGYRKPLYDLLRAAHVAGQPCPTARDVLDTWRNKRPLEVTEVMADGLKYYDAKGGAKPADLNAIRKAIGRMTR